MTVDNDITGRMTRPGAEADAAPGPRVEGVLTVLRGPHQGFVFTLDQRDTIIGRAADADIALTDEGLSRHHAKIHRERNHFSLTDLGSTNGTFVDAHRVKGQAALQDGQRILLGAHTALRFALHDRIEQEAARLTLELALRDPLTRLYNRRHLGQRLQSEAAYSKRHRIPLTVLIIDIDNFKRINDSFGHPVGDAVIPALTEALQATMREEDLLARYGGEEFAVVTRGIDQAGAITLGERVRVAAEALCLPAAAPHQVTVSVGIAHAKYGCNGDSQNMLRAADRALYAAKHAGRNRVHFVHFESDTER